MKKNSRQDIKEAAIVLDMQKAKLEFLRDTIGNSGLDVAGEETSSFGVFCIMNDIMGHLETTSEKLMDIFRQGMKLESEGPTKA